MNDYRTILKKKKKFSLLKDKTGFDYIKALSIVVASEPSLQNDEIIIELSDEFGLEEYEIFNALVYLGHKGLLNISVDEIYEIWFSYFLSK